LEKISSEKKKSLGIFFLIKLHPSLFLSLGKNTAPHSSLDSTLQPEFSAKPIIYNYSSDGNFTLVSTDKITPLRV
jgi:hypothetical protein